MNLSTATVEPFMNRWLTVLAILLIISGLYFMYKFMKNTLTSQQLRPLNKQTGKIWREANSQLFKPNKLVSLSFGALCLVTGIIVIMGLNDDVTDSDRVLLLNEQC